MVRGKVPAPLVFMGEAPGLTEDLFGSPFISQAGDRLNHWIAEAKNNIGLDTDPEKYKSALSIAFMNVLGCIPNNPNRKSPEPTNEELKVCKPRVDGLLALCKPKVIICVGKIAKKQADKNKWEEAYKCKVLEIIHPSAVLRDSQKHQDAEQRAILLIEETLEQLRGANK